MNNASPAPALLSAAAELPGVGGADWRVIRGDCLSVLAQLPEKSANMIFADPPYNLQLKGELWRPNMTRFNGVTAKWDKFSSFAEYDSFCESWLSECQRVLADDGTLWVIGSYHNIGRVSRLMQDLGFWLLNDVVWKKTNPPPNFRGVRFTNATETLVWAKKNAKSRYACVEFTNATETLVWAKKGEFSRYIFNRQMMNAENNGKQMRNVWEIPICSGAERLRNGQREALHPTQKPEELLQRILLSCTRPGDVVLDPFLGSGTTLAVARQLKRMGVGIERDAKYVSAASERIEATVPDQSTVNKEAAVRPRVLRRVPFSELIGCGLIRVGQTLYSPNRETKAKVGDRGGNVRLNRRTGSIHKMGAFARNAPECNGWTFWSVKRRGGEFVLIDDLRAKCRRLSKREGK